ncbi:MAG: HAMP domain-containing protein [Deltaproteobacteria bacterium]|nr:MAG: HAMP domain-containing protein [Deltaproteobacteria bacterium]
MPRRFRTSLRLKLGLATLLPLICAIAACWLIGMSLIATRLVTDAQRQVDAKLATAGTVVRHEIRRLEEITSLTALAPELGEALQRDGVGAMEGVLGMVLRNERLAFLNVVNRYGMVVYRVANPAVAGDRRRDDPLITRALRGEAGGGIALLTPAQMGREHPSLPERARIAVRPTPHAARYHAAVEERGLFLLAAAPVRDRSGAVIGVLQAGTLLNGDTALVDDITHIVIGEAEGGAATIFLGDLRIATSVRDEAGERAVGTLMSEPVREVVLQQGGDWSDRAFVYNDWFMSAYTPLRDPAGKVVGALYVGLPEAPWRALRSRTNLLFGAVLVCGALVGLALAGWLSGRLVRPVRVLAEGARRIARGESYAPIPVIGRDEIASLAEEFNVMTERLRDREAEIGTLNRTLEEKVARRTAELEEKGKLLLAAERELAQAERLAEVGLLAAGVAHEINNPLAIIRGNAELLQMSLPETAEQQEEIDVILRQTTRVERIVGQLRSFSRSQGSRPGPVDPARLLDDILEQIGHQQALDGVVVERRYQPALTLHADGEQLRQVCTNLILNALQAMAGRGTLTLETAADETGACGRIRVLDTGPGLPPDAADRLFTPFYTTKPQGTGLGLSVSYGIVREHGGQIEAANRTGSSGAVFTVTLPLSP